MSQLTQRKDDRILTIEFLGSPNPILVYKKKFYSNNTHQRSLMELYDKHQVLWGRYQYRCERINETLSHADMCASVTISTVLAMIENSLPYLVEQYMRSLNVKS